MARDSLKFDLNRISLDGSGEHAHKPSLSDLTIKSYKSSNARFADFCKAEFGIKTFSQLEEAGAKEVVQAYADYLRDDEKSVHTIHTYLAPVCKACGLDMAEIDKGKRVSADIKRGRYVVDRSEREANLGRYREGVELQKAIGIRRSELSHLTGKDLLVDREGRLYVRVEKGKGGKMQLQRILPQYEDVVMSAFRGIGKEDLVLHKNQLSKNINYHGFRADVAKEAYGYYASMSEVERDATRQLMIRKYERYADPSPAKLEAFRKLCYDDRVYRLRGDNLRLAIEKGLPIEYDRFALLAVSVEHLAHWRISVTVCNYMLA